MFFGLLLDQFLPLPLFYRVLGNLGLRLLQLHTPVSLSPTGDCQLRRSTNPLALPRLASGRVLTRPGNSIAVLPLADNLLDLKPDVLLRRW